MKLPILVLVALGSMLTSCGQSNSTATTKNQKQTMENDSNKLVKTEKEWQESLTPEQYYVLRQKGTESPFTGKYYLNKEKGVYVCAACGNELFTSDMKFDSGCGWPSFDREIAGGKIIQKRDTSHGMIRIEILCANCNSHLGHIFDDGPTETGMRYCVNSVSLGFRIS